MFLAGRVSAVHGQADTSNPACIFACQNNCHFGNIIREARAFQWVSAVEIVPRSEISSRFLEDSGLSIYENS